METLCQKCEKSLCGRSSLSDHERRHNGMAPYNCCGYSLLSRANLTRHRCSAHGQENIFKCSKCSKEFALGEDLIRHESQQTCGPNLRCDRCGVSFHNKNDLKDNMDKHSGEKKFVCECGKSYRFLQGLSRHRKACKS